MFANQSEVFICVKIEAFPSAAPSRLSISRLIIRALQLA